MLYNRLVYGMFKLLIRLVLAGILAGVFLVKTATAEVPSVAVDILPVQSLVAQVMGELGTPSLIMQPGASPHSYALRPSEARALQRADLVIWASAGLTPWLQKSIITLSRDARTIELMQAPGTLRLPVRVNARFILDADDAGDSQSLPDPHAWLDPENGKLWLKVIAAELSRLDPENAAFYRANAKAGQAKIDRNSAEIESILAPFRGTGFVVFHDAFQYFETRFSILAQGSISFSDASAPGPARVGEIRDLVEGQNISCVFAEPQFQGGLVATVLQDSAAKPTVIDPLGIGLPPGPDLYPALLRQMAIGMASCAD